MKKFPVFTPAPGAVDKPKDALDAARAAARERRYDDALKNYEWFFDHALDDDPAAFYGVRLSYCLSEWADLGSRYPPARRRLEERRDEALALLDSTRDPEMFHDYMGICRALEDSRSPLEAFVDLHRRDPELAASAVRFIWHEVVEAGMWDVAAPYVKDAQFDYQNALEKFEQAMLVCDENPDFGGEEFADQIRGWCVADLRDLWLVLMHSNRSSEAEKIKELALGDARLRNHPTIAATAFAGENLS